MRSLDNTLSRTLSEDFPFTHPFGAISTIFGIIINFSILKTIDILYKMSG